jgi:hypothetical protein
MGFPSAYPAIFPRLLALETVLTHSMSGFSLERGMGRVNALSCLEIGLSTDRARGRIRHRFLLIEVAFCD